MWVEIKYTSRVRVLLHGNRGNKLQMVTYACIQVLCDVFLVSDVGSKLSQTYVVITLQNTCLPNITFMFSLSYWIKG